MADGSGGGSSASQGGTGGNLKLSYHGGGTPGTFDPKTFGTTLFSDLSRAYQQGPQVNPYNDYVPYSHDTKNLIAQGIQNNSDLRNGVTGKIASGAYLGKGNPFLNAQIAQTANDVGNDVNSTFASNGRFGSDIHAEGLAQGLGNAENTARFGQYNTDLQNMFGAQNAITGSTANALGYSGLLDSKRRELNAANQDVWSRNHNADYNHIAQYLGLLNNGGNDNTNKPLSLMDILGGIGSVAGAIF